MLTRTWQLLQQVGQNWQEDDVPLLAAAIAYNATISLVPLLIVVVAVSNFLLGQEAAQAWIIATTEDIADLRTAQAIRSISDTAEESVLRLNGIVAVVTVGGLLFGATGVFVRTRQALDIVWNVQGQPEKPLLQFIKERLLSFLLIIGLGIMVTTLTLASTTLSVLRDIISLEGIAQTANSLVSTALIMLLFAIIFRMLPNAEVAWRDVWVGAFVTALLFTAGNKLIGLYLRSTGLTSVYGAAGSLVVGLLWVYFSALVFLAGAEITQVYANQVGAEIKSTVQETGEAEESGDNTDPPISRPDKG